MKKLLLASLSAVMFFSSTHAQFQKGNRVLGFGFNVSSQSNSGSASNNYFEGINQSSSFSVMLAKAKNENSLTGFYVNMGYGKSKSKSTNSQPFQNDYYSAGAGYFVRRYKSMGKNFFVFGEGSGGFNYSQQKDKGVNINKLGIQNYGAGISVYPGLAYKWNEKFLLELRFADFANIGFSYSENNSINSTYIQRGFYMGTSLGLGYLSNIGIGARWILK